MDPDEILLETEASMEKGFEYMTHEFAAVRTGKEGVLSAKSDGAHGAFDDVCIQFEAAIVEEADQALPVVQGIADRLRQRRTARQAAQ